MTLSPNISRAWRTITLSAPSGGTEKISLNQNIAEPINSISYIFVAQNWKYSLYHLAVFTFFFSVKDNFFLGFLLRFFFFLEVVLEVLGKGSSLKRSYSGNPANNTFS